MELSSQEGEIPIPIPINSSSTSYGGNGLMIHHEHNNHIMGSSNGTSGMQQQEDHASYNKKVVRYRECLKNHAAAMGGNATDGCGEFMPSGEEGTIEALNCSACHCHRNFHRKEVEGEPSPPAALDYHYFNSNSNSKRKFLLGPPPHPHPHPHPHGVGVGNILPSRSVPPHPLPHHHLIMPYNMGPLPNSDQSDDQQEEGGGGIVQGRPTHLVKKRFRTKFTQEQKDKMLNFAEKVGWKIQKQEESVVQQFCQEIGVKRRVLKVWMHNNKHNLAKKNIMITPHDPTA
ncbi:hypothetical protein RJT34_31364 [Clitoria ternatea]|uniref:ZF-HD dimerization-type domain-containing protein n=1 Tax=Clitoria ternatea TaxID=43366 RepID=A0AAN9I2U1_CLITE